MEGDNHSTHYYLSICSPDEALTWLRQRERPRSVYRNSVFLEEEDELEAVLLARNDPRIDFGLAQSCSAYATGKALYKKNVLGLRCALLRYFPTGALRVFAGNDRYQVPRGIDLKELSSLLANPSIADRYLEAFFGREECFADLSEADYLTLMPIVGNNPRMQTENQSLWMDGGDDYTYHKVITNAWELSLSAPVNQQWAEGLYFLLRRAYRPVNFDPVPPIRRWRIDVENPETKPHHWYGYSMLLRSRLADLLKPSVKLAESPDMALRLSYYRRLDPSKDNEWTDYIERDKDEFAEAAMENEKIWQSEIYRSRLRDACWKVPDPSAGMLAPNIFRSTQERMRKLHPNWFTEEETGKPSQVEDALEDLSARFSALERQAKDHSGTVQTIKSVVYAILVFSLLILWLKH